MIYGMFQCMLLKKSYYVGKWYQILVDDVCLVPTLFLSGCGLKVGQRLYAYAGIDT